MDDSNFRPPKGLGHRHIQTLLPTLLHFGPAKQWLHQEFALPDGDFVDLAWNRYPSPDDERPIVILFHGLEGSVSSPYAQDMMQRLDTLGWHAVMMEHFGTDRELDSITAGDAEEFRLFLHGKGLAEGTIRRRCGRAKQFLAAAVDKEILHRNPFARIRCGAVVNRERFHFVSAGEIQAVLAACPDAEWRAIFALARYAGVDAAGSGFRGVTLSCNVGSREAVDALMAEALAAGARPVAGARTLSWGGYAGWFADPDGHLWEIVWNPRPFIP